MLFINNDVGLDHLAKVGLSESFTAEVFPSLLFHIGVFGKTS